MNRPDLLYSENGTNAHVIKVRAWSPWFSQVDKPQTLPSFRRWAGEAARFVGRPWDRVIQETNLEIAEPQSRYVLIWF